MEFNMQNRAPTSIKSKDVLKRVKAEIRCAGHAYLFNYFFLPRIMDEKWGGGEKDKLEETQGVQHAQIENSYLGWK